MDTGPGQDQGATGVIGDTALLCHLDHPAFGLGVERDLDHAALDVADSLGRPREHPGQVGAVVAVADRGRAGVDPARVLALADHVLVPGESLDAEVDRFAGLAELGEAAVGEANILDRGHGQRLFAGSHAVAAEPGGGDLGPLDHLHRQWPQPEAVHRVHLRRQPGRLGAGADDDQVGIGSHRSLSSFASSVLGSATTRPFWSGLKAMPPRPTPSGRESSGRSSTSASTVRSTRAISSSA